MKAFKYRIYPNKTTKKSIDQTIWLCQILYNAALAERIDEYKINGNSLTYQQQQNSLPFLKENNPIYAGVYSQILQDVLKRLDKAYQAFFRRVKLGETPGFPRFQSADRYNSFTYPQGGYSILGNQLKLSKLGRVKIMLHRPMSGKIKTCTVIRKNGKYYACFTCEVEAENLPLVGGMVGIDMGIKEFCITSDGEMIENPRTYRKAEKELRQLQRSLSRKQKRSNNRRKARFGLAKQHEKVANQRRDIAYKTAKYLFSNYDTIIYEDLQIKNMVKNHHLAKSIADAGWGIFFNILESKAKQTLGKRIIAVEPKNTSQNCSQCGRKVAKTLSVRVHKCPFCGLELDRDINAAINILHKGIEVYIIQ
jgi:putative transposase